MIVKKIQLLFFIYCSYACVAQRHASILAEPGINPRDFSLYEQWCFVPKVGYCYSGKNLIEVGAGYLYSMVANKTPFVVAGPSLVWDLEIGERGLVQGPKLGLELDVFYGSVKLNAARYTNGKTVDYRFTPELGLAFYGYVVLAYGYNFKIQKIYPDLVSDHTIRISINIITSELNYRHMFKNRNAGSWQKA